MKVLIYQKTKRYSINVLTIKEMLNGFYQEDSEKFMSVFADVLDGAVQIKLN